MSVHTPVLVVVSYYIKKLKQYQHKMSFHKKNCILNILIVQFLWHKSARKKGIPLTLKIHKPFGLITPLAHWGHYG